MEEGQAIGTYILWNPDGGHSGRAREMGGLRGTVTEDRRKLIDRGIMLGCIPEDNDICTPEGILKSESMVQMCECEIS